MTPQPRILIVAQSGRSTALAAMLRSAGFEPLVVHDFALAKTELGSRPELLITELKLGAFNGLHLAIRASSQKTPTIVIGDPDPVFEAEAKRQHAAYLSTADPDAVVDTARELLASGQHTRRSPRKQVPFIDALVNDRPARLMDVSYEGLRLEASHPAPDAALPPLLELRVPLFNFACQVQCVWSTPAPTNHEWIHCGAELAGDMDTVLAWRTLVDELPGLAVTL